MGQLLQVEQPGVLVNDTIDGAVPEDGVLATELETGVAFGTMVCPGDAALELCSDGSFEYTPNPPCNPNDTDCTTAPPEFTGTDSFTYLAIGPGGEVSAPGTVTLTACTGGPQVFTCWKESSYLAKLAENGYGTFLEGFEGTEWDSVRSTSSTIISAPSITSQGIVWTSNHPLINEITTLNASPYSGLWRGYDPSHGYSANSVSECDVTIPPDSCFFHDGLTGAISPGGNKLQAVGGYISGFTGANIAIIIDGLVQTTIGKLPNSGYHFFGLIDTNAAGFSNFEFREVDGKVGQELWIYADNFIIATSAIVPGNTTPVADAGADQAALVGDTVTLDGSGSTDADGDTLTYSWSLTSVPAGSTAVLSDTAIMNPTFAVDLPGTYVAQLIVNDGLLDSLPDTVSISTINSAPVADAGADQTALVGDTVTLDGSGSTDVDGDALSYSWLLSAPAGSTASLSDSTIVNPTFVVDVTGTYVVQLIVNDGLVNSLPDTVTITTGNSVPVANAGADQSVFFGDTVTLDGSGSSDVDGDVLTYSWSFTSQPTGSTAILSDPTAVYPTFVVDVTGTYVVQLIVNDGLVDSAADTVTISTGNSAPVANAGADQSVFFGDTVTLDGSGSTDANGDTLTHSWSLSSVPAGSMAMLSEPLAVNPTFSVDLYGTYVVQLIVNDGLLDSAPDTVTITTGNSAPVANAGADQTALVGDTVFLDGSGSTDADGDTLTHSWSLSSVPAGSMAMLSEPLAENPAFIVDLYGTYVVQLIVNDGLLNSDPDTVTINTDNSAPVANAGVDQIALVGDTVTLDGSGSTDADGDTLTHSWSLSSVPAGSMAMLSEPLAENPAFIVDLYGTYVVQLIVHDGLLYSAADTVSISISTSNSNSAPVADAGMQQSTLLANTVLLDGSASSDADGDTLTYSWSLSSPAGSSATLSDSTKVNPTFVVDVAGTYAVQLIVNDGLLDSAADGNTLSRSCSSNPVVIETIQYNSNVSEQSQISITTNGNSVVVENAVSVSYQAPAIILEPGFHAQAGSQFTALAMPVTCL